MIEEKDSRIQGVEWSRKGNKGRRKMGKKDVTGIRCS
jgi:hypothetical protein